MLPVKKRFSSPDATAASSEGSPRATKRASISSENELELLRLKRDLAYQRLQTASRFSPSAGVKNNAILPVPLSFGSNVISPEAYVMPFSSNMLDAASAIRPPFPARRASECIDLTKDPVSKKNPLDLLSSVSTVVALSERRNSCPTSSSIAVANQQDPAAVTAEAEKYLGQRHPTTGHRHGKGIMVCDIICLHSVDFSHRDRCLLLYSYLKKYSNGCRYVGFFANDQREGYGKCW